MQRWSGAGAGSKHRSRTVSRWFGHRANRQEVRAGRDLEDGRREDERVGRGTGPIGMFKNIQNKGAGVDRGPIKALIKSHMHYRLGAP